MDTRLLPNLIIYAVLFRETIINSRFKIDDHAHPTSSPTADGDYPGRNHEKEHCLIGVRSSLNMKYYKDQKLC